MEKNLDSFPDSEFNRKRKKEKVKKQTYNNIADLQAQLQQKWIQLSINLWPCETQSTRNTPALPPRWCY